MVSLKKTEWSREVGRTAGHRPSVQCPQICISSDYFLQPLCHLVGWKHRVGESDPAETGPLQGEGGEERRAERWKARLL